MVTMLEVQTHIEVRYEQFIGFPGGSIWVRVQNRPCDYNDEWQCIWSTAPGNRGLRLSLMDPRFAEATSPAAAIAIPESWLPPLAVLEPMVEIEAPEQPVLLAATESPPEIEAPR